jgi:glutamate/tyrosine decarboxylase-like PLP-dependent enzyme
MLMHSAAEAAVCFDDRMEPEVDQLILESLNINYIDESEYPSTTNIQNRCFHDSIRCQNRQSHDIMYRTHPDS